MRRTFRLDVVTSALLWYGVGLLQETSEAEVQELLESEEFKALEAKRQEVHEKRAATLRITAEAYDSLDATIQKLGRWVGGWMGG
jgi:hypothetical protein